MTKLNFEKFTNPGTDYNKWCKIKLNSLLYISSGAAELLGLEKYEYVSLLYNKEENILGIKPLHTRADYSLKLTRQGTGRARAICLQSFISSIDMDLVIGKKLNIKWGEDGDLLIIRLDGKN